MPPSARSWKPENNEAARKPVDTSSVKGREVHLHPIFPCFAMRKWLSRGRPASGRAPLPRPTKSKSHAPTCRRPPARGARCTSRSRGTGRTSPVAHIYDTKNGVHRLAMRSLCQLQQMHGWSYTHSRYREAEKDSQLREADSCSCLGEPRCESKCWCRHASLQAILISTCCISCARRCVIPNAKRWKL